VLQRDDLRLLQAAELAAGGVDRIAFAVAEFDANVGFFEDLAERLATLGSRRLLTCWIWESTVEQSIAATLFASLGR
jgi:2-methylisocitrate lyase-like PEP mutase family enzyme